MKKVAFICPIYDMKNHFDLAVNLYRSKVELGIDEDFYFVFSDNAQKEKLSHRIKEELNAEFYSIVIPEELLPYKSKVVTKKFYALQTLMNKYDYLSVIDSESIFIKNGDFYKVFETIWEQGNCLKSNISYDGFNILRTCFQTMNIYFEPKLLKEFRFYKYNFWFNDIPVYKCELLPEFFRWLDQFDKNGYLNEWLCFEYYIFAAFLILEKGFHLQRYDNLKSCGGIMEYLPLFPIDEQKKILNQLGTHWSSNPMVTNEDTYLLFHLDRLKENNYGLEKAEEQKRVRARRITIIKDIVKLILGRI
jgi:hypothetical protein